MKYHVVKKKTLYMQVAVPSTACWALVWCRFGTCRSWRLAVSVHWIPWSKTVFTEFG